MIAPSIDFVQTGDAAPASDVPNVATEIVIEDLTLTVKRLRIGVALLPKQIDEITKVLSGSNAKVEATGSAKGTLEGD